MPGWIVQEWERVVVDGEEADVMIDHAKQIINIRRGLAAAEAVKVGLEVGLKSRRIPLINAKAD